MTLTRMSVVLCVVGLLGCKKPDPAGTAAKGKDEAASAAKVGDKAAETAAVPVAATAGNRSAAKTLNVEGMKAYKTKSYPAAIEKFRAAIAADVSFPLPHYNLACAAALSGDKATALAQLEWLAASSDPQARRTLIKASSDSDLKSLESDPAAQRILKWSGIFPGYRALISEGKDTPEDEKRLVKVTGARSSECEGTDGAFTAVRLLKGELAADHPGEETLLMSLADGAVMFDAAGKVIAKGEALDRDCAGGSQSGFLALSAGQVVADADPEFVMHSSGGGHGEALTEEVTVLKRKGDKLIILINASVYGTNKEEFSLDAPGVIRNRGSEDKQVMLKRWDEAKQDLVATPAPASGPVTPNSINGHGPTIPEVDDGAVGTVDGWTADGAFLAFTASRDLEGGESGPRGRINFGIAFEAATGKSQVFMIGTEDIDGAVNKEDKKPYAKFPKLAEWKAWKKEHPTSCVAGRTAPDGKTTAEIKVSGSAKKKSGNWHKDRFGWSRDSDPMDDMEGQVTLDLSLLRDGKQHAANQWTAEPFLDGQLEGNVKLCWAGNSEHAAWIIKRERGNMRDVGALFLIPSTPIPANTPAPTK